MPPAPTLPTFSVLLLPAAPINTLPRMRPLLLMVTPPVVPADRSMALVRELVTAPVPGVRMVLAGLNGAGIVDGLQAAALVHDGFRHQAEGRGGGGDGRWWAQSCWCVTLAMMLAFLPTLITGTLELWPRMMPKALP